MLSLRLQSVANLIRGPRHADIGSDHGLLPLALASRLDLVIAVEKHSGPLERLRQALKDCPAQVRAGDGLGPLAPGEVDSLSICGMGALNIGKILSAYPERLPGHLILQPMDSAQPLRRWALDNGWHLLGEHWVDPYAILEYRRGSGPDPAFQGLTLEIALHYGPLLLTNLTPSYRQELSRQYHRLMALGQPQFLAQIENLRQFLGQV